jgi:pimeloyl-ACP methyl ester carboxylesterase
MLSLAEIYPAGVAGVTTRTIRLSSGVHVRVSESGPRHGPPVLMLHGWGASLFMFRHALALLPAHGFRAIAVDLRGYGLSDIPLAAGSYALDAYLGDLDALFESLGIERATIIGQSMGGGVALHFALRHPARVKRLVLINPVGLVSIGWVSLVRLVPQMLMEGLGRRALPRWLTRFILRHIAFGDGSLVTERDVDENWTPTQRPGFIHAIRSAIDEFDWSPIPESSASALRVPTLVIVGTKDRVIRHARESAERLNGARVLTMTGGHCVHEEHPTEVYGAITEFIGPRDLRPET